jgi:hypothetical protein
VDKSVSAVAGVMPTTYPAKRTCADCAPPVSPSDCDSPGNSGANAADVDGSEEGTKGLERRSTRSRAAVQAKPPPVRRNPSASDRMQISPSVSIPESQLRREVMLHGGSVSGCAPLRLTCNALLIVV